MTEEQVFQAALELPDEAARAAYLDKACGVDTAFRRQVEALLAAHFKSGEFLDVPAAQQCQADSRDHNTVAHEGDAPSPRRPSEKGGRAEDNTVAHEADAVPAEKEREDDSDELPFLTPSTRPDSLGRLGHYEMLQVLGKGGFGIVFRAFDETLQRVVAVKVMAPQIATLSPARKRFLREARSSAQVRHENVVQVYEVGEQPLPYLAMEFIPGETLQQKLDRTGPLDVPEVLRIGRQIAEGLAAAHACDLIHRDIKPGNILLEGGAQKAKITDFGLARAADDASISQSGIIAGTPMFMAPEQALGHKIDQRADLFSLGSVLYQMVSGRPPFRAPSALAVLKRVAEESPRPIPEIIPETPAWLCDIIAKLHAKNPDDRFQSAREIADVLADCEAQLKAHAKVKDFSRIPRGKPQRSGRWKWAAAAAVLLLPVIALAVTEFAGVTHLFRGLATTDPNKPGSEPTPLAAKQEPPPLAIAPFDAAQAKEQQEAWAKYLKVPVEYTNSLGMKFRFIPPGKFMMGSPQPEIDRCIGLRLELGNWFNAEAPEHEVEITQPFYLGSTELTVGQFRQFVEEEKYQVGDGRWQKPGFEQADDHPVVWVAWQNAVDFCTWLSKKEGKKYRLPTEAEWEYGCRAGEGGTRYCFGNEDADLGLYAWYEANSGGKTQPVGKLRPNDWGLYDMHGNAWEWCQDYYDPKYYKSSPKKDPPGGVGDSYGHVFRGGSWFDAPVSCRSAFRPCQPPGHRDRNLGFRVVLVVSPPAGVPTESRAKDKSASPATAPFTDADVQRIAALPAEQQVEEVRKELMKRNPGFGGQVTHKIEGDVVTGLSFVPVNGQDAVIDLSPVRALAGLTSLHLVDCYGLGDLAPLKGLPLTQLWIGGGGGDVQVRDLEPLQGMRLTVLALIRSSVQDLEPLKGMPLTYLNLHSSRQVRNLEPLKGMPLTALNIDACEQIEDFTPLIGMPLTRLWIGGTRVRDLESLKGMKLTILNLVLTRVRDLEPLKGMPLKSLLISDTGVTDLSPLKGMPFEDIRLTPKNITHGLDVLRDMKTLTTIGISFETDKSWPAAEFWERYDKGEFKE